MAFSFRKPLNFKSASAPAAALLGAVALLMLPLLSVLVSWLQFDALASSVWQQMLQTVLPDYALTTFILCTSVAVGVALVGMATASAVTLFDFPGRRLFEWALLLPLAMPAYVVAYAYTDFCSTRARCSRGRAARLACKAACCPMCAAWAAQCWF